MKSRLEKNKDLHPCSPYLTTATLIIKHVNSWYELIILHRISKINS
jgi:hypothetical protein